MKSKGGMYGSLLLVTPLLNVSVSITYPGNCRPTRSVLGATGRCTTRGGARVVMDSSVNITLRGISIMCASI